MTPQTGMKLTADVDEFYLARVRVRQTATITVDGKPVNLYGSAWYPQVRNGVFRVDLDFEGASPAALVEGATAQGRLQLGGDTPATVLPAGSIPRTYGRYWVFVLDRSGTSADRRRIKAGRRNGDQLEVLSGLRVGERVITSDYVGFDRSIASS